MSPSLMFEYASSEPSGDHAGLKVPRNIRSLPRLGTRTVCPEPSGFTVQMPPQYESSFHAILPFLPGKVAWADPEISRAAAIAATTRPRSLRIPFLPVGPNDRTVG